MFLIVAVGFLGGWIVGNKARPSSTSIPAPHFGASLREYAHLCDLRQEPVAFVARVEAVGASASRTQDGVQVDVVPVRVAVENVLKGGISTGSGATILVRDTRLLAVGRRLLAVGRENNGEVFVVNQGLFVELEPDGGAITNTAGYRNLAMRLASDALSGVVSCSTPALDSALERN